MAFLDVSNLTCRYEEKDVLHRVSFQVNKGELFGVIGPNGSGKSTLLKSISQWLPISEGTICLNGKPVKRMSAIERAQSMAVLPQAMESHFGYTVESIVLMGRYPHVKGLFKTPTEVDRAIVREAMVETSIDHFSAHYFDALSGGEKQRVLLARALAQKPSLLLLDEPTNHLDIHHQVALLETLSALVKEKEITVLIVLHDLNLASLFCDQILLMDEGKALTVSEPKNVFQEEVIHSVYQQAVSIKEHPDFSAPITVISRNRKKVQSHLSISKGTMGGASFYQLSVPVKMSTAFDSHEAFTWIEQIPYDPHSLHLLSDDSHQKDMTEFIEINEGHHCCQVLPWKDVENQLMSVMIIFDGYCNEGDVIKVIQTMVFDYTVSSMKQGEPSLVIEVFVGSTQLGDKMSINTMTALAKKAVQQIT